MSLDYMFSNKTTPSSLIKHDLDSTTYHTGVVAATEDNFLSFDAAGLPKDSGKNDTDYEDAGTMTAHTSTYDHTLLHAILHDIDSTSDHTGVSGATEDNFLSFDAAGLPKDSGHKDADYEDAGVTATHAALTVTHGTSGNIMGLTLAQTVTNKTMDADNNTFSNFAHGAEVDEPSSGVHGVGVIAGTTETQTLYNKRIVKRIQTAATATTLAIDSDTYDVAELSALAAGMNIPAPTGTPTNTQDLEIYIYSTGSFAIAWDSVFVPINVEMFTSTVALKQMGFGCKWAPHSSTWNVWAASKAT